MDTPQDEATEAMLGEIIAHGSDAVLSFLNDTDGLQGQGEEAGNYDGSFDPMPVQGDHEDGSDDPMTVQEGDRDDGSGDRMEGEGQDEETGSGDRTESGQVYILIN